MWLSEAEYEVGLRWIVCETIVDCWDCNWLSEREREWYWVKVNCRSQWENEKRIEWVKYWASGNSSNLLKPKLR